MNSTKKTAKMAGILYLFMILTGIFSVMYVPGKLMVKGDAAATATNILAAQSLFTIHIVNQLVSILFFLSVVLVLYLLLKEVNNRLAALMVILVLIQIPGGVWSVMNQITALDMLRGADFWSAFDNPQREALAMSLLDLNGKGTNASELFWGLWLFPLGLLVFRSGFLPRFMGIWLIINCFAYVSISLTGLMIPQYSDIVTKLGMPVLLGEVAFMLWLLVMGAKSKPFVDTASPVG
ncbi:MAG: DUF4386 domain-containing protein [Thermodesulfovibrionales bacterium]|nr:DUF4386 domain-containing protein [Thermodesulfovibrionales bacterium]